MGFFDWLREKPKPIPPIRLTVFCMEELLPCPLQIAHPDGLLGSLVGVPQAMNGQPKSAMNGQRNSRLTLETPMVTGGYTFSGGSGTVAARVNKRSAGDPYPGREDAAEAKFQGLGAEERSWLERSSWVIHLQICEVKTGEAEVVRYLVEAADRLAALAAGLVLDEVARRYYLPGEWQFHSGSPEIVT